MAPFCGGRDEPSPAKVFDGLACGRPVVASAIPSVAALFSRANGVVLVEPDRADARRLGGDERTFVEERFGCDAIVLTLRDLVKQIVPHDHDHHWIVGQ